MRKERDRPKVTNVQVHARIWRLASFPGSPPGRQWQKLFVIAVWEERLGTRLYSDISSLPSSTLMVEWNRPESRSSAKTLPFMPITETDTPSGSLIPFSENLTRQTQTDISLAPLSEFQEPDYTRFGHSNTRRQKDGGGG